MIIDYAFRQTTDTTCTLNQFYQYSCDLTFSIKIVIGLFGCFAVFNSIGLVYCLLKQCCGINLKFCEHFCRRQEQATRMITSFQNPPSQYLPNDEFHTSPQQSSPQKLNPFIDYSKVDDSRTQYSPIQWNTMTQFVVHNNPLNSALDSKPFVTNSSINPVIPVQNVFKTLNLNNSINPTVLCQNNASQRFQFSPAKFGAANCPMQENNTSKLFKSTFGSYRISSESDTESV
jgi:hypothetical protein